MSVVKLKNDSETQDPLFIVSDEISCIQSLGAAFLALAEKEDLPGRFSDLIKLMTEQAVAIVDKLDGWKPVPEA
jgi:hypothetical protein